MTWFFLTLATALTQAVKDVLLKRSLARLDVGVGMVGFTLSASVFFWIAAACAPHPDLGTDFWPVLLAGGLIGGLSFFLYGQALRDGDLSLTLPMLAFTPLFLLVTSPLTLGEFPDTGGLFGLVCVVAGTYVLNLGARSGGALGPFRALVSNPGARLMLLVAAIWSIGANVDKLGVRASSPEVWIASVYTASAAALVPGVVRRCRGFWRQVGDARGLLLGAGLLEAAGLVCQMHALTLTQVAYVIAVKRLSIVFGVVLGALVFRERDVASRLPGAILMVLGVSIVAVFG